jgi:hypothetical protein
MGSFANKKLIFFGGKKILTSITVCYCQVLVSLPVKEEYEKLENKHCKKKKLSFIIVALWPLL